MAVPPAPPPLEQLGPRPFSFYPPIGNIAHNEWLYQRATWSEVLVRNTKSGDDIWVPRRLLGEISRIDEPVMIVGLTKEMEYRAGALWPVVRRVIEMPVAVNEGPRPSITPTEIRPAVVVGIRVSDGAESRIGKLVLVGISVAILACVLVVSLYRGEIIGNRIVYSPILQTDTGLTNRDDYFAVVRALGPPQEDRWKSDRGEFQYRLLGYPKLGFAVILMGADRKDIHYIGAMDKNWNPVHTVPLPGGGNSYSILHQLKRF
ncbi:MAG: hypothetical protein ABSH09_03990 [Bryobacteraceae bacterium]